MGARHYHLHDGKRGVALAVRVTPRARRNEISGIQDDGTINVRISAAPTDNQANEKLIRFLADALGIAPTRLDIVAGRNGRDKLISIIDMDGPEVEARLRAQIA
jgi:uncharacterized protein (TIGR00251 family)